MKRAISQEFSFWQLLAFSVPAVAMLVVSSLYTAVDGVFVSRFVGSDGLSAINIVLPLDTLAFGVGIMFGTGTSAIVGRKLGQGEAKAADQDLTLATLAAGVLGAVLSVALCFWSRWCGCWAPATGCCPTAWNTGAFCLPRPFSR